MIHLHEHMYIYMYILKKIILFCSPEIHQGVLACMRCGVPSASSIVGDEGAHSRHAHHPSAWADPSTGAAVRLLLEGELGKTRLSEIAV